MRVRVQSAWKNLQATYWFKPAAVSLGAVGLFALARALEHVLPASGIAFPPWFEVRDEGAARLLISAIVQSVVGVAGITFSVTMAALTLASSQYGPRLLRNFLADSGSQWVLGIFVGTAVYGLLTLRAIGRVGPPAAVSVNLGILLGFLSLGALVYFIHHIAKAIHADELTSVVARDLRRAVDRTFPAGLQAGPPEGVKDPAGDVPDGFERGALAVGSGQMGYLQAIDEEALMTLASGHDLLVRVEARPGDFVVEGRVLARVWPRARAQGRDAVVRGAFVVGQQRTPHQDLDFSVNELVEIALRALSPAVNDPFVASACIDRLGDGLAHLAAREAPAPYRYDDGGRLRVVAFPLAFEQLLDHAFGPLRHDGAGIALVVHRLLFALRLIGDRTRSEGHRAVLRHHAERIRRAALREIEDEADREGVTAACEETLAALAPRPGSPGAGGAG